MEPHDTKGLMSKTSTSELCSICGTCKATTRDHVPPKGIFLPPRPNLITVPACHECNQGASKDDENFRAFVSMHGYGNSHKAEKLFWDRTVPRLRRNPKFRTDILSKIEPVNMISGKIFIGRAFRGKWDSEVHHRVIERIMRGLYFHHFREILGDCFKVNTQWLKWESLKEFDFIKQMKLCVIDQEQFTYLYVRTKSYPLVSIWIFEFFKSHWASGYTCSFGL